jgi:predicted ATPase
MEEKIDHNENPFSEEFSREDVVNTNEFEEEDELKQDPKSLLNDEDIQEIIELDDEARRAVAFVDEFANEEEKGSSVIKRSDAEKDENILKADLEDLSTYAKKIKKTENKTSEKTDDNEND